MLGPPLLSPRGMAELPGASQPLPDRPYSMLTPLLRPPLQGMAELPGASQPLPDQPYSMLRRCFPSLSEEGLDLLKGLLTYDPLKRTTARQALRHPWFEVGSTHAVHPGLDVDTANTACAVHPGFGVGSTYVVHPWFDGGSAQLGHVK